MFRIEMLPARQGDCLWIEYGEPGDVHRVLIDGGPEGTFQHLRARIEALPPAERRFELIVVSHVDRDHIAGIVPLLQARGLGVAVGDVWFNGWRHLAPGARGPVQGEILGAVIQDQGLPWNQAFDGDAVVLAGDEGAPVTHVLPGGLRLTLLSPDRRALDRLAPVWERTVRAEGLEPGVAADALEVLAERPELQPPPDLRGDAQAVVAALAATPFEEDRSQANGSSIAFLAEFEGRRCLFAADAHPSVLEGAVRQVLAAWAADGPAGAQPADRLPVDAFKLAHHGGERNLSPALASLVPARRYLVSTNGSYYGHPDGPSLARVVTAGPLGATLCFNYRSQHNAIWDDPDRRAAFGYGVAYPTDGLAITV